MINKIGKITVYVEDQMEAKDFWINKIGFVLKAEIEMGSGAYWLEVGPSEEEFTTLVLYSKSLMNKQQTGKTDHPSIIFSTTNIGAAYEKMQENGVRVGELMSMSFGTMFTFYDQDGNEYLLREDR